MPRLRRIDPNQLALAPEPEAAEAEPDDFAAAAAETTTAKTPEHPDRAKVYRYALVVLGDAEDAGPAAFGLAIVQGCFSGTEGGHSLTLGRDAVRQWGEHFADLWMPRASRRERPHKRVDKGRETHGPLHAAAKTRAEQELDKARNATDPMHAARTALHRARQKRQEQG